MSPATESLDRVFQALANPTRRAVVVRLGRGPAPVSELAAPFDMSMPAFLQHIQVLEASGVVRTKKRGRVRTVSVVPARLTKASAWLEQQRSLWEARLDQLDDYLGEMQANP
ncbi:ArsR/SmtB family transcription factor [Engelhardtia mirabilis]|uniref:HTH-type transcriptional regulator n=1 Tax=Engelhardtia mirabilis TaxID=2528011 RepID=A0A518BGN9_9BACT|nr:HTH-type transcriptional regulator [Planctomycetes bacterium Pla133]QDV00486.1 HTH-type transcriptional regulator [Planctomycetes bacterium Pla86]